MAFGTLSKAACCARGIRKLSDRSKKQGENFRLLFANLNSNAFGSDK